MEMCHWVSDRRRQTCCEYYSAADDVWKGHVSAVRTEGLPRQNVRNGSESKMTEGQSCHEHRPHHD